jgi:hypothetical protein
LNQMLGCALVVVVGLAIGAEQVAAQRFIHTDASVGEVQLFQSNATEFVALGGARQQLFRSSRGDVYAQLLFGVATGYSRRCDLCGPRVSEFGLGANVALDDRWAVRVRGDIRVGGSAADLLFPTLGVGITRRW